MQILRQLSQMENNQFTTRIFDIIVPTDPNDMSFIFIVMEYMQTDLKKIFQSMDQLEFSESHMVSILYNMLCAMNFIHTANLMHRDIKPANILLDLNCNIKLCDFGLAR